MRVVIASGPIAGHSSLTTGSALARAWADLGTQAAVVPMGEAGRGFTRAWADLTGAAEVPGLEGVFAGAAGIALAVDPDRSAEANDSRPVGELLAAVLARAVEADLPHGEVWLDVAAHGWADGGAGFWHALAAARASLAAGGLHLVTTSAEQELHLTGFRGITAAHGRASGMHPGDMLAADQALVEWCAEIRDESLGTTPGAGAVGGLGAAVLALGGDVVTGPAECARLADLPATMQLADVVVTGYDQLDFGSKGGDLVPLVCELAEQAMRPCIAVARENFISARELRTMGLEQGFDLGEVSTEDEVTEAARRIASSWHW